MAEYDSDSDALDRVLNHNVRKRPASPRDYDSHCLAMRSARGLNSKLQKRKHSEISRQLENLLPTQTRASSGGEKIGGAEISVTGMLRSCFGKEGDRTMLLADHKALSIAATTSTRTVKCSQLLAADCIFKKERHTIANACASSNFVLIKRVWDEATLFFNMGRDDLKGIIGDFADFCPIREPKFEVLAKRKQNNPCLTAQVLNQELSVRWGSGPENHECIVVPACIVPQNTAEWLFAGLDSSFPECSADTLAELASKIKRLIIIAFPDGHGANELVIEAIAAKVKSAILIKFICVCHGLAITINTGIDAVDSIDPQYSLASCLSLASNVRRLGVGVNNLQIEVFPYVHMYLQSVDICVFIYIYIHTYHVDVSVTYEGCLESTCECVIIILKRTGPWT
jgi:hypothetical protein